jgi:uncharacterized protein YndB with AHSA1/START domain
MAKREIWHEIIVNCSLPELFEAVTQPGKIAHWWTTDVRGESQVGKHLEIPKGADFGKDVTHFT